MNIAFYLMLIIILIIFWSALSPFFKYIGEAVIRITENVKKNAKWK